MKFISPYLMQAYIICPREAWLEYHSLTSDQEHELLVLGRLIHDHSYSRERKEIFVDNLLKIDLFRDTIVAEVKKSSRHIESAKYQLAYYLYYLKYEKGLTLKGILLFPKEKKSEPLELTPELEKEIEEKLKEMKEVLSKPLPPPPKKIRYCKTCSFEEICWA